MTEIEEYYSITPRLNFNSYSASIELPNCLIIKFDENQLRKRFREYTESRDSYKLFAGALCPTDLEYQKLNNKFFLCFKEKECHDSNFYHIAKALLLLQKNPARIGKIFMKDGASGTLIDFMAHQPRAKPIDIPVKDIPSEFQIFAGNNNRATNGSRLPLPDLDGANVGLKAWDEAVHLEYTGRPKQPIFDNFAAAFRAGLNMKANVVYVPGLVDLDQVEAIAAWLAALDSGIPFHVMGYIPVPGQPYPRPTDAQMEAAVAVCPTPSAKCGLLALERPRGVGPFRPRRSFCRAADCLTRVNQHKTTRLWLLLAAGVILTAGAAMCFGGVEVSPQRVFSIICHAITGHRASDAATRIVLDLRLPRVVLVIAVGAALGPGRGCRANALSQSPGKSLRLGRRQWGRRRRGRRHADRWRRLGSNRNARGEPVRRVVDGGNRPRYGAAFRPFWTFAPLGGHRRQCLLLGVDRRGPLCRRPTVANARLLADGRHVAGRLAGRSARLAHRCGYTTGVGGDGPGDERRPCWRAGGCGFGRQRAATAPLPAGRRLRPYCGRRRR